MFLFLKKPAVTPDKPVETPLDDNLSNNKSTTGLIRAISGTENRKIIAVQMYSVESEHHRINNIEKTLFHVRSGESFIRKGHDVNSVSSLTYELERTMVDEFEIILQLYQKFRKYGDEDVKKKLIILIDETIAELQARLKLIETEKREVTKEDCCIARVLVLYLSFKHILTPDPKSSDTQANYIGEISLNDGDLNLSPETETKLFTVIRTGLLGAALLGENNRHVFFYRKDGIKQGRKYCASQLMCTNLNHEDETVGQNMKICLFTVEEKQHAAIPGYVFESISKREELIQAELNKMVEGDDSDATN